MALSQVTLGNVLLHGGPLGAILICWRSTKASRPEFRELFGEVFEAVGPRRPDSKERQIALASFALLVLARTPWYITAAAESHGDCCAPSSTWTLKNLRASTPGRYRHAGSPPLKNWHVWHLPFTQYIPSPTKSDMRVQQTSQKNPTDLRHWFKRLKMLWRATNRHRKSFAADGCLAIGRPNCFAPCIKAHKTGV